MNIMLTNKVKHPNPSLCSIQGVLTEGEFQKRKHEILFDVSTDALSILDLATGQFIECNNAAVKMMGLSSKSEFLYSTPADWSPEFQPSGESSQSCASRNLSKAIKEGPQCFMWTHMRADGALFPCLVSLTALPVKGRQLVMANARDVSEFENTNQLFRLISENNQDYLFAKDSNFRIVYANKAFLSLYPKDKRDKVIGYTTLEEYEQDEAEEFLKYDKEAFEKGFSETFERILFPNGEYRTLHTKKIKFVDSANAEFILGVARDVTEREALLEQLQQSNNQLSSLMSRNTALLEEKQVLFNAMLDSVIVIDKFGKIKDFNRAAETLFGYDRQEMIGLNVSNLMNDDDAKQHDAYLSNYLKTGHAKIIGGGREVVAKKKSGQMFYAFLSISQCETNGEVSFIGTMRDISEQVKKRQSLEYLALHDSLTKLPSRRLLEQKIEDAISESIREDKSFCILYLDLNKFKPINDCYGHDTGDEVLKIVSKRMRNILRDDDVCARVGGDEFVIVCKPNAMPIDIDTVASKISRAVMAPIKINDNLFEVGISVGSSCFPHDGDSMNRLLRVADDRMYTQKRGRENECS